MDITKKIPDYHTEKGNIRLLIFLTAVFALIFINIYSPFNVNYWYKITDAQLLLYSSLIILTGVMVVVISRIIMYRYYKRGNRLSYMNFGFWILAEIASMSLFYTLYEQWILHDPRNFSDIFVHALRNTTLVLLLPYSAIWLYLSLKDKKAKLAELAKSDFQTTEGPVMIPFKDEGGVIKLSLKKDDFLYCRGMDNYVIIFYNDRNTLSKFMIRNTLKNMEAQLNRFPVVRSHRSYIINLEKVKLIEKTREGMKIKLDWEQPVEIPVSKTYLDEVFRQFGKI
jgi:hypothetical protein